MKNLYEGNSYTASEPTTLRLPNAYSIKRLKMGGWAVYHVQTGAMQEILATRIKAYYYASRMNKIVSDFFKYQF